MERFHDYRLAFRPLTAPPVILSQEVPGEWVVAWHQSDDKICTAGVDPFGSSTSVCYLEKDLFPGLAATSSTERPLAFSHFVIFGGPPGERTPDMAGVSAPESSVVLIGYVRGAAADAPLSVTATVGNSVKTTKLIPFPAADGTPVSAYYVWFTKADVPDIQTLSWGPYKAQLHDATGAVIGETAYPRN